MAGVYNSVYTGQQIDAAIAVVRDSGITNTELARLHSVTSGTGTASKVLILDANRKVSNIAQVTSALFKGDLYSLKDLSSHPVTSPESGYIYLYFLNGRLYTKNSAGTTSALSSGQKKTFNFTSQSSVNCNHQLGVTHPLVSVIIGGVEIPDSGFEKDPVDGNNMTVRFNSAQTGQVIIREV